MHPRNLHRRPPAGAVYVAVLGVAMILALIGLASLHLSRVETDVLSGAEQIAQAELLGQSAVERAMAQINANASWRSTYASGVENPSASWTPLGSGGVRFALVDADGNLADDANDSVTLRGIGRYGEATQVVSVDLQPTADSLDCLDVVIHSAGNLTNMSTISCSHVVSSNGDIDSSSGNIGGDAWAVGIISGSVSGVRNPNMTPARQMPDTTSVWEYYLANGTRIDIDDVPGKKIEYVLISAGNNPYGEENSQGIYIVDCEGQALEILKCRIYATLVIINPGAAVKLDDVLHWDPPAANYPSLMVRGDLEMTWDGGSNLSELAMAMNFNPPGSPFEGLTDIDVLDSYPGVINGLVYVSGNLLITNVCMVDGVIVAGGTTSVTAVTNLTYDSAPAATPPPGFAGGNVMRIIPRTWRRSAR